MGAGETAQSISGIFVKNTGAVGINDNDPSEALEVSGNIRANGSSATVKISESGGATGEMRAGGATIYIGTETNHSISIITNDSIKWYVDNGGTFYPASNNSYDIGTASYRVRNIYGMDLQLSNKGKLNDVDGTWGDYTVQEGESDLFLINNRNGKKYKFNLSEVS